MFRKLKAWLEARLYIQTVYRIPNTGISMTARVNRLTGQSEATFCVPRYVLDAEVQRLTHPVCEMRVHVEFVVPEDSELAQQMTAPWN